MNKIVDISNIVRSGRVSTIHRSSGNNELLVYSRPGGFHYSYLVKERSPGHYQFTVQHETRPISDNYLRSIYEARKAMERSTQKKLNITLDARTEGVTDVHLTEIAAEENKVVSRNI